jgi:hypothetical protein
MVVFFVALLIRAITLAVVWPNLKSDANWDYYRDLGRNLATGNGFVATSGNGRVLPNVMRTPGYPLLLAGLIELGGDRLWLFLSVNCVLGAITCALTVVLASRWVSLSFAMVAGILVAIDPNSVVRCATLMTDTLFTLVLIGGTCVLAWRSEKLWGWFVAGLLWSLAVLCRPIAIWLWSVAIAVALVKRARIGHLVLLLAGFFPLVGLWVVRNAALTGHRFFSTASTYQMVVSWATGVEATRTGVNAETIQRQYLVKLGDLEFYDGSESFERRIQAYRQVARDVLRPAPLLVAKGAVLGWGKLLFGPGQRTLDMWVREPKPPARWWPPLYSLALVALVALSVWGAIRLRSGAVLPAALAAYFIVTGGGPLTNSRFRCPIIPVLATLAVAAFPKAREQ